MPRVSSAAAGLLVAGLLATGLAGCGGGDGNGAAVNSPPDRGSDVTVEGSRPTSNLVTGGGRAESSVEVRVADILSQLRATQTGEGTLIRLPERVLFDFDKADLKPEAAARLDELAEVVRFYADAPVAIGGHTDALGADAYNEDLSRRRAESVRRYLIDRHQIGAGRVRATGYGETRPVAANTNPDGSDNPAGREQNRRVEVLLEGVRR